MTAGTGNLTKLSSARLHAMMVAGDELMACQDALSRAGSNPVAELIGGDEFFEQLHYPKSDVYDEASHSQFYYHSHRGEFSEHGHFHTFLRAEGMPDGVEPHLRLKGGTGAAWPGGLAALSHIIAVSVDDYGDPVRLFTVNRWVTGETWYPARDVIAMLGQFSLHPVNPYATVRRWISSLLVLFGPDIEELVRERDRRIDEARRSGSSDPLEDRNLEVISSKDISISSQIRRVRRAATGRS